MADSSVQMLGGGKWKAILAKIAAQNVSLKVGVLESSKNADSGMPVAQYAYYNEYGAKIKHPGTSKSKTGKKTAYFRENKKGQFVFSRKDDSTFEQDVTIEPYEIIIPARPFMRNTVKAKEKDWAAGTATLLTDHIMDKNAVANALGKLGEIAVNDIQQTIQSGIGPANAPSTIKRKAAGRTTLQDSFDLFNSIACEVNK